MFHENLIDGCWHLYFMEFSHVRKCPLNSFSTILECKNFYLMGYTETAGGGWGGGATLAGGRQLATPTMESSLTSKCSLPLLNFAKRTDILCTPTVSGRYWGINIPGFSTWYFFAWKYLQKFVVSVYPIDSTFTLDKTVSFPGKFSYLHCKALFPGLCVLTPKITLGTAFLIWKFKIAK